jgi:hypothetical protein
VFKRGKSIPKLGAFHSSDIPEFYGSGVAPDFIGTDALGMFFFQAFVAILCAADLPITTTTIQSILPILEDPLFRATLLITVSSLLWTGNHGVRQMIIRF